LNTCSDSFVIVFKCSIRIVEKIRVAHIEPIGTEPSAYILKEANRDLRNLDPKQMLGNENP